jgi:hypothetical protein
LTNMGFKIRNIYGLHMTILGLFKISVNRRIEFN